MLEQREYQPIEFRPVDLQVIEVIERVEGMCINKIDKDIGFERIEFRDASRATGLFRPTDHEYYFFASVKGDLEPHRGPYASNHEASNVLVSSLIALSYMRMQLTDVLGSDPKSLSIRVVSECSEGSELKELAEDCDVGEGIVLNGIKLARDTLFHSLVPEEKRAPRHTSGKRDDGSIIGISTFQTVIDGVEWRIADNGTKREENIRIKRKRV